MSTTLFGMFVGFAVIIVSIVAHEISHGYAAYWLGDDTAKMSGRLSLNPLKHLDPIGSFLVPLLLILSGTGLFFGWAKPVPIRSENFKDPQFDEVKVALAGPITNFLIAAVAALIFRLLAPSTSVGLDILIIIVQTNLVLMLFNLVPIPPLDGSRLFGLFLPQEVMQAFERINPLVTFFVLILLINSGFFSSWLGTSVNTLSQVLLGR